MNFIFISDIHFQTWLRAENALNKAIADTISYGSFEIPDLNKSSNPFDTILVLGGDVWNSIDYAVHEDLVGLEKFLKTLKYHIEWKGLNIKKIYLGEGNHELYNHLTVSGYSTIHETRGINHRNTTNTIEKIFKGIKVISSYGVNNKIYGENISIINALLYSPIVGLNQYTGFEGFVKESEENNYNISATIGANVNDFNFIENSLYEYNMKYISILPKEIKEYVEHKYNLYKNAANTGGYNVVKTPNLYKAQVLFFSELSKILFHLKKVKTDTLILNLHFPFDYFTGIKYDLLGNVGYVDKNKIYKKQGNDKPSYVDGFFNIDISWFEFFMSKIPSNVKHLYILNGHTHEKYKIDTIYNGINVHIINNCLGYCSEY